MIKNFMNKVNPTYEKLEQELVSNRFDESSAAMLLDSGKIDLHQCNQNGDTLLHTCLKNKKFRAANWLLQQQIDLDKKDKNGKTGLRTVVETGEATLMDTIVHNYDLDINNVDEHGRSLLQDAVISGNNKMASKLLEHNIDINIKDKQNKNVAFDAISYGDEKVIHNIISHDDIDLNIRDHNGKTILLDQKVLWDDELAKKLLENGADPTICDNAGHNFLTKTALRGASGQAILDVAIKCGCDINKKVANEKSILMEVMYAFASIPQTEKQRREGLKSVAQQLVRHGININAIDDKNETALFDLVRVGDIEGCAFVLEHKVDVNYQNNDKETALNLAILKGVYNLDLILLLLQYGANPTLKNKNNQTIPEILNNIILQTHGLKNLEDQKLLLNIHSEGNYLLILKEILANEDFDFNYLDSINNPLFFTPFLYGDKNVMQLYIQNRVDINLENIQKHNIFYEYVLHVFKKGKFDKDFRDNLIFLLINKANRDCIDIDGQNIYTKVATLKKCNINLFKALVEVTKHNYKAQDNLGRTIMHYCVFNNNIELLKLIYGVERDIQNISDNFNMLPITYAALGGKKDIVKFFIHKGGHITTNKTIPLKVREKFSPLLVNITKLLDECKDPDWKRKLTILRDQLLKDFTVNESKII